MQQALDLAVQPGRELQAQDPDERRALEVAQDLQRVADTRRPPSAACAHEGQTTPPPAAEYDVSLRLDLRAALEAARQLRAEPHRLEQVELEPARDDLARDRVAGVEPGERLGQQPERLVGVGRTLAEAVGELDDVPGGGGRVQVVAQAEMGVLEPSSR